MKNFHNIENSKSPFGNYRLGYAKSGTVFKITDAGAYFQAEIAPNVTSNVGKKYQRACLDTIKEISAWLENN